MRLIDADALSKNLGFAKNCKECKIGKNCTYETFSVYGICTALADAPTVAKDINVPGKWISVKDRLPTYAELRDDHVLVLFEDGTISSIGFDECIEGESIFGEWRQYFDMETLGATDSEWMPIEGVTHWMPMPEPPEPQKEDE